MRPPDVEAPDPVAAGRAQETNETEPAHIATSTPNAQTARKREATVIALLAIHAGHAVHRLLDGEYLVTWRGLTLHCRDLAELEAHARRVGAVR